MTKDQLKNKRKLYLAGLLFLIAMILYLPALFNGFLYDDTFVILENPWIKSFDYISNIFFSNEWGFTKGASKYYRPTFHLVLMAQYRLFNTAPWGYHLTSVFFHAINTVLVFMIAHALFPVKEKRAINKGYIYITPFLAALIFALHTVNSTVVNWVSAVSDLLFTLFYLAAFYLYISVSKDENAFFRKPAFYLSLFIYFLAILSKETAATFLIFIIAFDLSTGRGFFKKRSLIYVPYFLITVLYMVMRTSAMGTIPQMGESPYSLFEVIINIFPLILAYMSKLLVPINISVVYTYTPVLSLTEPRTLISILVTLALLVTGIFLRKKKTTLFCFIWIFIPLMTVLYFPIVFGIFSERYLYLSSAGFAILCAYIIESAINSQATSRNKRRGLKMSAAVIVAITLSLYIYGTIKRTYIWRDQYSLWSDAVKKSPESGSAHNELGTAYMNMGKKKKALYHYRKSLSLNPRSINTRTNLGNALVETGRFNEAILEYKKALRISPYDSYLYYNYAVALSGLGKYNEAERAYHKAIELNPAENNSRNNLANLYMDKGDVERAEALYTEIIRLDAKHAHALNNMGILMSRKNEFEKSISYFTRAIKAKPGYANAHYNFAITLEDLGRLTEAVERYQKVIKINPTHAGANNNIGEVLLKIGDHAQALKYFKRALKIEPSNPVYRNNLKKAVSLERNTNNTKPQAIKP